LADWLDSRLKGDEEHLPDRILEMFAHGMEVYSTMTSMPRDIQRGKPLLRETSLLSGSTRKPSGSRI
jgi:hypothetical protein